METIKAHYRKINCEVCKKRLLSVYVRGKKFYSLEDYYWCENCNKIYKLGDNE